MSESFKSPSLAQHFEAPDNFRGRFGWLCGYSADADFLNDAAERFTRQTQRQRAYEGRIALALMLDPGNPPVRLDETPAVMHLPIRIRIINHLYCCMLKLPFWDFVTKVKRVDGIYD